MKTRSEALLRWKERDPGEVETRRRAAKAK
jgi:hypothetical protein